MRASDADRDRVVDVLRDAAGDGRLTTDELEERLGAALSSRTIGELAALTADLVTRPGAPGAPAAPGVSAGPGATPARARDTIRIDQRGGAVRRTGRWTVPRRLELRSSWCDVVLDFTDAVITHDTLRIDMNVRGGSLTLVAGPGIIVDADSLRIRYTDLEIGPTGDPGAPVTLRVELSGRMRYGWVGTRPPQ